MVEYYVKGQTYTPGTILKWKNGTKVQIQQNGGHKIVSTKKIISKHKNSIVNDTQEGGEFMITKIINHVKGTKYAPGTFVKLSNDMVALVQQNGGYKFLYNARTRARKSKRKQFRRLQDKQNKKQTQTAIISGGSQSENEILREERRMRRRRRKAIRMGEKALLAAKGGAEAAEAEAAEADSAASEAATSEAEAEAAAAEAEAEASEAAASEAEAAALSEKTTKNGSATKSALLNASALGHEDSHEEFEAILSVMEEQLDETNSDRAADQIVVEAAVAAAAESTKQQSKILDKLKGVNVNLDVARADLNLSAEKTDTVLNDINDTTTEILKKMGPLVEQVKENTISIKDLGDMFGSRTSPGAPAEEAAAPAQEAVAAPTEAALPAAELSAAELPLEEAGGEGASETDAAPVSTVELEEDAGAETAETGAETAETGGEGAETAVRDAAAEPGAPEPESTADTDAAAPVSQSASSAEPIAPATGELATQPNPGAAAASEEGGNGTDGMGGGYLSGGAIQSKKQIYNLFRTPHKIKDNGELEVINKHTHKMKHLKPMLFFKTSKNTIQLGFIMVELLKCEVNTDLSEYLLIKPLTLNIDNVDPPIKACNKKCTVDNTKQLQKYIRDVFNKKQFKQIFDDPNKNLLIMYILDHKTNIELQLVILNSQTNTLTTFDEYMECSSHAKADSSLLKDSIISKWFGK